MIQVQENPLVLQHLQLVKYRYVQYYFIGLWCYLICDGDGLIFVLHVFVYSMHFFVYFNFKFIGLVFQKNFFDLHTIEPLL